jgi:general secretion pathway protein E
VAVTAKEAVIADAEPNVRDWEPELARIIKREIKRVIANPVDIERYQVEFYNLAKSMKGASKAAAGSGCRTSSSWSSSARPNKLDANDAHIVQRGGLALAVRLRAARERHPRRAAPRARHRALPHRRRAAPGLPDPRAVLAAMTSRIKILARMDVVEKRRPQDGRIKTRTADGEESSCASRRCRPPSAKSW